MSRVRHIGRVLKAPLELEPEAEEQPADWAAEPDPPADEPAEQPDPRAEPERAEQPADLPPVDHVSVLAKCGHPVSLHRCDVNGQQQAPGRLCSVCRKEERKRKRHEPAAAEPTVELAPTKPSKARRKAAIAQRVAELKARPEPAVLTALAGCGHEVQHYADTSVPEACWHCASELRRAVWIADALTPANRAALLAHLVATDAGKSGPLSS